MPFTKEGIWNSPTEDDIREFSGALTQSYKGTMSGVDPEAVAKAIDDIASANVNSGTGSLIQAIPRIHGEVDIVIPIYGGLHVLKKCVNSVLANTEWPFRLILVDDASPDPKIAEFINLRRVLGATVLFNRKNRGFAATVNRGVAAGSNPYVVVLNSDVIVTKGWITKMLIAMEADVRNQIVNPATNNTALINVPMYPGASYLDMSRAVDRNASVKYPECMPTGFCFMVRRSTINEIGPLDEAYGSYGEETDFWYKTIKQVDENGIVKGYRAVLCDNAYVFHERGTSFGQLGEMAHRKQRESGSARFRSLHPGFAEWQKGFDSEAAVNHLRTNLSPKAFKREHNGNIAWVVKSAGSSGGMLFISDVANELIERGFNVKICVVPDNPKTQHIVVSDLHTQPIMFNNAQEFLNNFTRKVFSQGIVFAAVTELTPLVWKLAQDNDNIMAVNHVQSWDVELAKQCKRLEMVAQIEESYKVIPNLASSQWVADEVEKLGGKVLGVVTPGVNPDLFHPRFREKGDERYTVGILLNPHYPFKGYDWAVEVCRKLAESRVAGMPEVRILGLGVDAVPGVQGVVCTGYLSPSRIADLLANEVDLFIDPSVVHSYGLPGLEAFFSGCEVITRSNRGVDEYIDKANAIYAGRVHKIDDVDKVVDKVLALAPLDTHTRFGWSEKIEGFRELERGGKVDEFIKLVFPKKKRKNQAVKPTRIEVITPHIRKHGGPTTIISMANSLHDAGHNVSMSMIYTDWNPEVFAMSKIPFRTKYGKVPSDAKVVIINSDNPFAKKIMENNPGRKYIMYKLSHNPRFQQTENDNLNLPWDHIMTSTGWLRDACLVPMQGWTHQAWPADKVTVVGWYHYGHERFNTHPHNRTYGDAKSGFRVGTLIHEHPLKGTNDALAVIEGLQKTWGAKLHPFGVGESRVGLPSYMGYNRSPNRKQMSDIMKKTDIWLGASHSEGLGRMTLEAMSAGAVVVTTDTGAEFLKDGENCILYPVGDTQAAYDGVNKVVSDREFMVNIITNSYATACRAADNSEFTKTLNNIIAEVRRGK